MNMTTQVRNWIKSFNNENWECFDDTPTEVVSTINQRFIESITDNDTPVGCQHQIYSVMDNYIENGFLDSEPMRFVTDVINSIYGTNITKWDSLEFN